jgi:hypothetical protein
MREVNDGEPGGVVQYTYGEKNAFLAFLQQPRIMLLLLAAWSVLSALAETFTSSQLFSNTEAQIDGLLAGLAFGWEGFALAAVYLYCFRNPDRYPKVFWLAAIQMGALTVSMLYHWLIVGTFSIESVIVPLAGTLAIDFLLFAQIFGDEEDESAAGA